VRLIWAAALVLSAGLVAPATVDPGAPLSEWAVMARLAPESLLLDVAQSGDRLLAVGERGHILVSGDAGRSWTQAKVPTRALLTGVYLHDSQLGWAVGHDAVVLRTRDGGVTWERVHHAPENERPLLDVWFKDAERGLAVGAYGELLATSDGGDSWQPRAVRDGDDFHLNQLAAAADGTLYLAAEAGHLYRSDDGGETWVPLPSPYEGSFFGLLPLAEGPVLAFGLRGRLFSSADRGKTWTRIETATEATLLCALQVGPGRFVVAGMEGTLLWGEGVTGPVRTEQRPDRQAIVAIAPNPGRGLLLFGEGGVRHLELPR
jgi:photosystem II stability/assembly factor-like uncharacterized protein